MKRMGMAALAVIMGLVASLAHAADEPVFSDFSGKARSIESYAGGGKWLVVMIWSHDCHVCNMEAEQYAYFHDKHQGKDATVLGVSMDGVAEKADAQAFIERHDVPFPNLIGEPQTTMLYYTMLTGSPFRGTPSILLFDPAGELVAANAGAVPTEAIEAFMAKHASAKGG